MRYLSKNTVYILQSNTLINNTTGMSHIKKKNIKKMLFSHRQENLSSSVDILAFFRPYLFLLFYPDIALFGLSFRLVLPIPYIYDICFSSSLLAVIPYSVFLVFLCRPLLFVSCHFCILNPLAPELFYLVLAHPVYKM